LFIDQIGKFIYVGKVNKMAEVLKWFTGQQINHLTVLTKIFYFYI